jgi:hypothetical protein
VGIMGAAVGYGYYDIGIILTASRIGCAASSSLKRRAFRRWSARAVSFRPRDAGPA